MYSRLESVDWAREGADAVELLRALIRFDTTNPPGAEAECIAFLADHLRMVGLEPEVLCPGGGRANLVLRLRGGGDGDGRAAACCTGTWMSSLRRPRGGRGPPFGGEVPRAACGAAARST